MIGRAPGRYHFLFAVFLLAYKQGVKLKDLSNNNPTTVLLPIAFGAGALCAFANAYNVDNYQNNSNFANASADKQNISVILDMNGAAVKVDTEAFCIGY